ncbi:hypothetical protein Prudu_150S000300, partial [Prunus dulcis]
GASDPSPSKRRPGHHRPSQSPPWVPTGPPPCRRQDLTDLHPGAALRWPENHVFRRRFPQSHPNFQLKILPRFSTKSIEHQESANPQEGPSRGPASSDQQIAARLTLCPETCRIADQADYGPLHPARATRADLVSSRNLPAGQAD